MRGLTLRCALYRKCNLCIPRNETARPLFPIPTFMYQSAIYIFPGLVCLFWRQTELVGLDFKSSDWKLCSLTLAEFWKLAQLFIFVLGICAWSQIRPFSSLLLAFNLKCCSGPMIPLKASCLYLNDL